MYARFSHSDICFSVADMSGNLYWREPFRSICTQKHLTEFTVLNVEYLRDSDTHRSGQKQSEKVIFIIIMSSESSNVERNSFKREQFFYCLLGFSLV